MGWFSGGFWQISLKRSLYVKNWRKQTTIIFNFGSMRGLADSHQQDRPHGSWRPIQFHKTNQKFHFSHYSSGITPPDVRAQSVNWRMGAREQFLELVIAIRCPKSPPTPTQPREEERRFLTVMKFFLGNESGTLPHHIQWGKNKTSGQVLETEKTQLYLPKRD